MESSYSSNDRTQTQKKKKRQNHGCRYDQAVHTERAGITSKQRYLIELFSNILIFLLSSE